MESKASLWSILDDAMSLWFLLFVILLILGWPLEEAFFWPLELWRRWSEA